MRSRRCSDRPRCCRPSSGLPSQRSCRCSCAAAGRSSTRLRQDSGQSASSSPSTRSPICSPGRPRSAALVERSRDPALPRRWRSPSPGWRHPCTPETGTPHYPDGLSRMSVLRNLESKIGGLVEGAFSRAFKSNVEPVELARKLAKEMEESKMASVSRVYVPNHYRVFLSVEDREQFASYEGALRKELSDYLLEHARAESLALTSRPAVEFMTDERLELGEFGIQAQLLDLPEEEQAPAAAAVAPSQGDFGHTMVYSPD